jgi:hypothetical protein
LPVLFAACSLQNKKKSVILSEAIDGRIVNGAVEGPAVALATALAVVRPFVVISQGSAFVFAVASR